MQAERVSSWQGLQSMVEALGYSWHELRHLHHLQGSTFSHRMRIPKHYARQIRWDDPNDPLLIQVVPSLQEHKISPGEMIDPIGDHEYMAIPGGIHRYPDRLLLWPHLACGVHCRFCFRRNDVGTDSGINWQSVSEYIQAHPEIREVILSGGDPGMLHVSSLQRIVDRLINLPIQKFRLHSRVLATDPEQISDAYLNELAAFQQSQAERTTTIVHHVNHSHELTSESADLSERIAARGIAQKAQGVLLRGVNDTPEAQVALWSSLAGQGIGAYYLHHLDKAQGTSHFRLSIEEGLELYDQIGNQLPANLLPKYILDLPGGFGKVQVTSLRKVGEGEYAAISPVTGEAVTYSDPAAHQAIHLR
jgi:lysine 2,3-aminomutase